MTIDSGECLADRGVDHRVRLIVLGCRISIDDYQASASVAGQSRQAGCRFHDQGRSHGQQHLCTLASFGRTLQNGWVERLAKRNCGMFQQWATTLGTGWHGIVGQELCDHRVGRITSVTLQARDFTRRSMQFPDVLRSASLWSPSMF